jgi:hypothetical protein
MFFSFKILSPGQTCSAICVIFTFMLLRTRATQMYAGFCMRMRRLRRQGRNFWRHRCRRHDFMRLIFTKLRKIVELPRHLRRIKSNI